MAAVIRLVTFVDDDDGSDSRQVSVSARHEALLDDGRRVLLLDDRGWSESGPPDIWTRTSIEQVRYTAQVVVGPDEPFGGLSPEDMEAGHWAHLSDVLRRQAVVAAPSELSRLPHDVVLSEELLARLGPHGGAGAPAAGPTA